MVKYVLKRIALMFFCLLHNSDSMLCTCKAAAACGCQDVKVWQGHESDSAAKRSVRL